MFDFSVDALKVGSNMDLEIHFLHWAPRLRYLWNDDRRSGRIVFARKHFPFLQHKQWVGNWCWDRIWMRGPVVIDLLNWLRPKGWFDVSEAEDRLFNWWKGGYAWKNSDIRLLAKEFD